MNQFIKQPPRRCRLSICVFGAALTFAAGGLTAHLLHENELLLANKIAKTANRWAADLQAEVDRTAAELAGQRRKNWELAIRIDSLRQPFTDLAELTAAVRKLHLPTLQPGKCKPVPKKAAPPPSKLRFIPPPKSASVPAAKSWAEQITAAHNKVRAAVGVPPLLWDTGLAAEAGQGALRLAETGCQFKHSAGRTGENLFGKSGAQPSTETIVSAWAAEQADYDYPTNTCAAGKTCGHYTQMVWQDTDRLGCGLAECAGGKKYIAGCKYSPAGNSIGQRPY
jgi:pathogenesis-related protein 1